MTLAALGAAVLLLGGEGGAGDPGASTLATLTIHPVSGTPVELFALDEVWVDALSEGPGFDLVMSATNPTLIDIDGLSWPTQLTSAQGHTLAISNMSMSIDGTYSNPEVTSPPWYRRKGYSTRDGDLIVRFGYRLTASASQPPGTYTGLFTIEADAPDHNTGQITQQMTLTVEVRAPISVTTHPLDAGVLSAGVSGVVDPGDAAAGRIEIAGDPSASIEVEFSTVPTQLAGPNGATMPVQLTRVSSNSGVSGCDGPTPQNLVQGDLMTDQLPSDPAVVFTICLGGLFDPNLTAEPGDYSGVLTLTVQYAGS